MVDQNNMWIWLLRKPLKVRWNYHMSANCTSGEMTGLQQSQNSPLQEEVPTSKENGRGCFPHQ